MAKHQPAEAKAPQKNKTIFLCFIPAPCFNFSDRKPRRQRQEKADATGNKNLLRRWLCWSRPLKLKKSSAAAKTVPVDGSPAAAAPSARVVKSKKFQLRRSGEAETPWHQDPTTVEEAPVGGGSGGRIKEMPSDEEAADENLAVEPHVDPTHPPALDNTCPSRNLPTRGRKPDAGARAAAGSSGHSQPGSPVRRRRPAAGLLPGFSSQPGSPAAVRSAVMSPSSSSPLGPIIITKNPFTKSGGGGKKLEPVVGMSVIMVTLVIMIMWGRICAIICTSAWLYIVPKFRSRAEGSGVGYSKGGVDMESEEYKKKVVLEGLLDRTSRRT